MQGRLHRAALSSQVPGLRPFYAGRQAFPGQVMIYDLSQPLYNDGPRYPGHPADSIVSRQHAAVKQDTVEKVQLMTHSGSHVDAPFHFLPELPSISELPLSHFYGPCVAINLRPLEPCHTTIPPQVAALVQLSRAASTERPHA